MRARDLKVSLNLLDVKTAAQGRRGVLDGKAGVGRPVACPFPFLVLFPIDLRLFRFGSRRQNQPFPSDLSYRGQLGEGTEGPRGRG
jgi:hypothetical protein